MKFTPLIFKRDRCIELHCMSEDIDEALQKWAFITNNYNGMLSICTARGHLSEEKSCLSYIQ